MSTRVKYDMSTTTKNGLRNSYTKQIRVDRVQTKNTSWIDFGQKLTVSTLVKTMLEIIKVKKSQNMDEETRKQFPAIAKEIILLAEQTQ
jgi:hypothetical protein